MIKTGLEIVEMIKKGNVPKKIIETYGDKKYIFFEKTNTFLDFDIETKLLNCLNTEFEVIEEKKKLFEEN